MRRHLVARVVLVIAPLLVVAACSSTTRSTASNATTTSGAATTTTVAGSGAATTQAGTGGTGGSAPTSASSASTLPPTTKPTTTVKATTPPTTTTPGPKFVSVSFSGVSAGYVCPSPAASVPLVEPEVTITWQVTGADSVYVAIDNVNGPWESNLPLSGTVTGIGFAGCTGTPHTFQHTYYVVAVKGSQKVVKSKTFTGQDNG